MQLLIDARASIVVIAIGRGSKLQLGKAGKF
jgi:hypothetical protein